MFYVEVQRMEPAHAGAGHFVAGPGNVKVAARARHRTMVGPINNKGPAKFKTIQGSLSFVNRTGMPPKAVLFAATEMGIMP